MRLGAPGSGSSAGSGCRAPSMHLYLAPSGEVRACCNHQQPLGWIPHERLADVWRGQRRTDLVAALAGDDYSRGCWTCQDETALEGRAASYAAVFDDEPLPGPGGWPTYVEFNLSNRCNLRCVQCNPELSSAIRALTDLPPLAGAYDDQFFEDLREFLPHLHRAQFAGGEPFLAPENYRVWDLVEELAPGLDVTVVTNATHLTPKVRDVLERVPMSIVLSLDGASATTFESIRLGASFDEVVDHVDWFADYARRAGTRCSVNHCLMPQNVHEFGDLLCFAEDRGLPVRVSVVRAPADCALSMLPAEELVATAGRMRSQDADLRRRLELNRGVWERELARIESWAAASSSVRAAAYGRTRADTVDPFARPGAVVDIDGVRDGLRAASVDGTVHELVLDRTLVVRSDVSGLAAVVGEDPVGRSMPEVGELLARRLGPTVLREVLDDSVDGIFVQEHHRDAVWRAVLLPRRDADGWAQEVVWLAAEVGAPDGGSGTGSFI